MQQARQAVFGKAFLWVMLATLGLASCGGGGGSPPHHTAPAVTLRSLSVTPTPGATGSFTGGVGFGRQMVATGTYSDGTTADLTSTAVWSSSSTSIATVSAGVVTGVALGTATITATYNDVAGSGSITITSGSWALSSNFAYEGNNLVLTGPTATVLADGNVLVRGDDRSSAAAPFASGEYSFLPDSWISAGEEVEERGGHTATLLQNGKVLVTGGTLDINPLVSCELYDPTSKTWSAAASLPQGREQHAAVLLTDGRVLIVGGSTEGVLIPDAEVYDPSTNTWSDAGAMLNPSIYPTATLLANGTVFVMDGDSTGTTEIYDPTTNSWSAGPTAGNAHENGVTATTLTDGRILIVGGTTGVEINPITLAYPEIYDPVAGAWSPAGTMTQNRTEHIAVRLLNGTVLVAGGVTQNGLSGAISSAEIYDPGTNTWTLTGSLNFPSAGGVAVLLPGGQVFMLDGGSQSTAAAELYW